MASTSDSNPSQPAQYDPSVLRGKDGFFTSTYQFFDGLGKHKGALFAALGAVLAVGVVGSIVSTRKAAEGEQGKNALFLAQKAHEDEMKAAAGWKKPEPPKPAEAAKGGGKDAKAAKAEEAAEKARRDEETAVSKRLEDLTFAKLDVDSKFPQTVQKYRDVIAKYSGTRAGYEARMALGGIYFNHGEAAKAVPLLKEAVDAAPGGHEKSFALSSLGYAQENAGAHAEALAAFEKALNQGDPGIKGDLLLAIARSHEALKDGAKARSTYDRIIAELPNTDAAKSAESLKSLVQ